MKIVAYHSALATIVATTLMIAACGGGTVNDGTNDDNPDDTPATYAVGGTVAGLSGSGLVLQLNGGQDLAVGADGAFTFVTPLASGASYDVTILGEPAWQSCVLTGGSGIIASAAVTSVDVACSDDPYVVGGTLSGLTGDGLVLQNNGGDDLALSGNGPFAFATTLVHDDPYAVSVLVHPPGQRCGVSAPSGVIGANDVTSVVVSCIDNPYEVGGSVVGLTGSGLVLQNNGGDDLPVSAASFTFPMRLATGEAYDVTIAAQPTGQLCVVEGGAGTIAGASVTSVVVTCGEVLAAVAALYPAHGAKWNDYVKNDGADWLTATDTACAGTELGGYSKCLHGGELRVLTVPAKSSCAGLSATDALGVFAWTCDDSLGSARIVSTGLVEGKGLADLVSFAPAGWRVNSVRVYDGGSLYGTSAPAVWWTNPVAIDNDGGNLAAAGTVYLVTSPAVGAGYVLAASRVALVVEPGTVLAGPGSGSGSYPIEADGTSQARDFLWIEADVDAAGDDVGVFLNTVRFSVLRNVSVTGANAGYDQIGVYLGSSQNNLLTDVIAADNGEHGVRLWGSNYNTLRGISTSGHTSYGLFLVSSGGNDISDVIASDNSRGVYLYSGSGGNRLRSIVANDNGTGIYAFSSSGSNRFADLDLVGNGNYGLYLGFGSDSSRVEDVRAAANGYGIYLSQSAGNRLARLTLTNNTFDGLMLDSSSNNNVITGATTAGNVHGVRFASSSNNVLIGTSAINNGYGVYVAVGSSSNTLHNVVTVNNGNYGVYLAASAQRLADIAALHNGYGLYLSSSSNNTFGGLLVVGNNTSADCFVNGGSNTGIDNSTCANNNGSDATLVSAASAAASFVGKVTSDDAVNASDNAGTASYSSIVDWTGFATTYRGWGLDGGVFPASDQRGRCTAGSTCRIWDHALVAGDSTLRAAQSFPTGNDTLIHTWSGGSTATFLRHATELGGDSVGNENWLCEASEPCLYLPNLGSYPGHGSLTSAGAFVDGTVTGVTFVGYGTNGY